MFKDTNYCKAFIDTSRYVFKWLCKQPSVNEESITNWLLYNLSEELPSLKYRQFTRHVEAKTTGADWEWWFVDNNYALCLRIQAKKIYDSKDNYDGIAYTNQYGLQIEKLISDATLKNSIPFYSFYYAPQKNPKVLCGGQGWDKSDCGIFISSATKLHTDFIKNGRKKVTANDILIRSNPMHCLVCCMSAQNVVDVYEHIRRYYQENLEINSDNHKQVLHKDTPTYVKALLDSSDSEIPKWFEKEFDRQIKDINSIFVVDMRKQL